MKPRRWFRFNLRTFFALVVLAAIPMSWIAAQLRWIRERHAIRAWLIQEASANNGVLIVGDWGARDAAPWRLRIFGEQNAPNMLVSEGLLRHHGCTIEQVRRLFPEGHIVTFEEQQAYADKWRVKRP